MMKMMKMIKMMKMMKMQGIPNYEIVAYLDEDNNILCPHCWVAGMNTRTKTKFQKAFVCIFAEDEWEYEPHCDECGEEISVSVIKTED